MQTLYMKNSRWCYLPLEVMKSLPFEGFAHHSQIRDLAELRLVPSKGFNRDPRFLGPCLGWVLSSNHCLLSRVRLCRKSALLLRDSLPPISQSFRIWQMTEENQPRVRLSSPPLPSGWALVSHVVSPALQKTPQLSWIPCRLRPYILTKPRFSGVFLHHAWNC